MRVLLALLSLSVAGCGNASPRDIVDVNPGGATNRADIELGVLQPATNLKRLICVRNASTSDAQIVCFRLSCECATIVPADLIVKAGRDALCEIYIDLRKEPNFTGQMGIHIDGCDQSDRVILQAVASMDVRPTSPGDSDVSAK